jgi:hypothetical protein
MNLVNSFRLVIVPVVLASFGFSQQSASSAQPADPCSHSSAWVTRKRSWRPTISTGRFFKKQYPWLKWCYQLSPAYQAAGASGNPTAVPINLGAAAAFHRLRDGNSPSKFLKSGDRTKRQ